jgi:thermitase
MLKSVDKQFALWALLLTSCTVAASLSISYFSGRKQASTTEQRFDISGQQKPVSKKLESESKVVMNDPAFSQKWGLKQSDAQRAWELSTGSKDIIVAVIDTGVDINHEDLDDNLWVNPGETGKDSAGRDKRSNGIDDDGNGFVDDVHGWNFVSNNKDLSDNHGHGTHISGIIGAEAGNGVGVSGVAPKVQIMTLKYFDPKVRGTDNLKNTIKSIRYAVKMGAHIINYSGGGLEYSASEYQAVKEAMNKGILFIAASGNERSNSDLHKYYPADYDLPNVISVTAIDPKRSILSSSNYGFHTVDIAAPGQNILSTLPRGSYGYMTGTSQATGFVTGAAVIVKANNPAFSYRDIKKFILATGESEKSLVAKIGTGKRLNLFKALAVKDARVNVSGLKMAPVKKLRELSSQETEPSETQKMSVFGKSLMQKLAPRISEGPSEKE